MVKKSVGKNIAVQGGKRGPAEKEGGKLAGCSSYQGVAPKPIEPLAARCSSGIVWAIDVR